VWQAQVNDGSRQGLPAAQLQGPRQVFCRLPELPVRRGGTAQLDEVLKLVQVNLLPVTSIQ
jgi:hypothetical protein